LKLKLTPKQDYMIRNLADVDEVFWGGAAGGGKSEGLLMFALQRRLTCPGSAGLMLRRTFPELEKSLIRKSLKYYSGIAKYNADKKLWKFPNSSIQEFGYCQQEKDVYQYQSAEYDDICFDELTHFTAFQYLYMLSRLRTATSGQPWKRLVRSASNPGNIGHQFVKSRFVDVARDQIHTTTDEELGTTKTRYFLPATLSDNTLMSEQEKSEYLSWLRNLPKSEREMLESGNWDYVPGAAFAEISRQVHMIDINNPPDRLLRLFDFERMTPKQGVNIFRSMDWGYAKPFSIGWYFADYDGRIYRYREMYGCKGPNEGVQMPAHDVAVKTRDIEADHKEEIVLAIADASIWDKPSNQNIKAEKLPSIAETMSEQGVYFDRTMSIDAKKSRLQGKHQMHERLRVDADGLPHFQVFSTCVHWWRTVPVIPTDTLNPEDVDTDAEDHAYDESRYLLSARPMQTMSGTKKAPPMSLDWYENVYMKEQQIER
jgi:hypothetical protein